METKTSTLRLVQPIRTKLLTPKRTRVTLTLTVVTTIKDSRILHISSFTLFGTTPTSVLLRRRKENGTYM